jgi:hypothetical protein
MNPKLIPRCNLYKKDSKQNIHVRFQVLTAASMKMTIFWNVAIALMMAAANTSETSMLSTRLHGATSQKTVIFS